MNWQSARWVHVRRWPPLAPAYMRHEAAIPGKCRIPHPAFKHSMYRESPLGYPSAYLPVCLHCIVHGAVWLVFGSRAPRCLM